MNVWVLWVFPLIINRTIIVCCLIWYILLYIMQDGDSVVPEKMYYPVGFMDP
jgi:hypothetical protein